MTTYQDAWEELLGAIKGWKRQLIDADLPEAPEIEIYDTVLELMSYIEAKVDETEVPEHIQYNARQAQGRNQDYWNISIETLRQWAEAALPGAPEELKDLAARICWSILNGSNPNPEARIVDTEAIGFLAGAVDHADELAPKNTQLGVSSGSIDPVL